MSQDPSTGSLSPQTAAASPVVATSAATVAAQSMGAPTVDASSDRTVDDANPKPDPTPPPPAFVQPIVAVPDRKFFVKRMVIVAVVFAVAGWFFLDGYYRYPKRNAKVAELTAKIDAAERAKDDDARAALTKELRDTGTAHSDLNLWLQKVAGFPLTALGVYLLVRFLKESKGELRLEDDTLHAPGHPPVPIGSITGVENARWDKKGIALFDYRLADGTAGRVRIDDFVFTRPPTDAIHDELIAKMPRA